MCPDTNVQLCRSRTATLQDVCYLTVLNIGKLFSEVVQPIYTPSYSYKFLLLYTYEHFILWNILFFRQFYGHKTILPCISLIINEAEQLFKYLLVN